MRNTVVLIVSGVWVINFGAGLALENYEADQAINGIFMAIVGGLFALGARDKAKNGEKEKDKDEGGTE